MRKAVIMISVLALVVGMYTGTALAKTINGDDEINVLIGTDKRDTINGFGGDDVIRGYGRSDVMIGGMGDDRLVGGRGYDKIDAADGSDEDFVVCGSGRDRVRADGGDTVTSDCEEIRWVDDATPGEDADCSDGLDNDGDGKTDFPEDPDCSSAGDASEAEDGGTNPPGDGDLVTICHKPDTPAQKETIKVTQGALQGHLGHGDTLGECDDD